GAYDGTFREDWQFVAGSGDLDQCNGRFGVTPEFPEGIYHYYLTEDYPYIPRCVWGTPDPSFRQRRTGGPGGPGFRRRPPSRY
ncbi:MAG: YHYH protein, partial [Gemmatimonadota bacterium]|nr:YHYH protein [Gemmatimonadota bacterium]